MSGKLENSVALMSRCLSHANELVPRREMAGSFSIDRDPAIVSDERMRVALALFTRLSGRSVEDLK